MTSAPLGTSLPEALSLGDAIDLGAAWVTKVAADRGIRILIIKGAGLAHHGLRAPRISADVDVLVDPARFDDFCELLIDEAWRIRPITAVGAEWSGHSVTFIRDDWPCDIDAHRYFPGFLAGAQTAFDALWRDRTTMLLANRSVQIPDRNGSILVAALHHLRDGASRSTIGGELDQLVSVEMTPDELGSLAALAVETGALGPVAHVLEQLGLEPAAIPQIEDSPALRAWNSRIAADASGPYFWLLLLRNTPARHRPSLIARAIWPSRADIEINNPGTPDSRSARAKVRLTRIPKGLRSLPRAIRALRASPPDHDSMTKVSDR
ncbi:nucleotidyltransferase family protein [Microbacterium lacus]|uniref:nucleotidyltransferase family protein n=1 Tax=Microbacterium lacus TaxID=415217 RepID=UPI00384BA5DB